MHYILIKIKNNTYPGVTEREWLAYGNLARQAPAAGRVGLRLSVPIVKKPRLVHRQNPELM